MENLTEQAPDTDEVKDQKKLVTAICGRVQEWKKHWERPLSDMRKHQAFVRRGADPEWDMETINITQRHVRDRVATLYAKQPTTVFKRRPRREFRLWDETWESLQNAYMQMQAGLGPQAMMAQQVIQDATAGMRRRQILDGVGATLSILFDYYQDEQMRGSRKPMKRVIRRGIVSGVGYVKPGFQRLTRMSPESERQLSDHKARLAEIERRGKAMDHGDFDERDAEAEELRQMISAIQAEPQVIVREGLVFHFPASDAIIPDKLMTNLVEFEGCEEVAEEFIMSRAAAERKYGIRITGYTPYTKDGGKVKDSEEGMVCVWKVWNISTGLVHTVADGFDQFLTNDFTPPIKTERFWPWFQFIPNPSDDPEHPWPISEIELVRDGQMEFNRQFAGQAEARVAARPGTVGRRGMIDDKDAKKIQHREAFEHIELNLPESVKAEDALAQFPTPSYNPALYETGTAIQAIEAATGASEARVQATPRVSATASGISETAFQDQIASIRDELDDLNSEIARHSGQIMMMEMSAQEVEKIVGPGYVWPQLTMEDIRSEIWLEAEFGSSGRKNRREMAAALRDLTPLLIQSPGVSNTKLVKAVGEALAPGIDPLDLADPNALSMQAANALAAPSAPPAGPPGASGTEPKNLVA